MICHFTPGTTLLRDKKMPLSNKRSVSATDRLVFDKYGATDTAMRAFDTNNSADTSRDRVCVRHAHSARIRRTEYGAVIELSGGRRISLWAFALDEPVLDVALRRARRDGASHILIDVDP